MLISWRLPGRYREAGEEVRSRVKYMIMPVIIDIVMKGVGIWKMATKRMMRKENNFVDDAKVKKRGRDKR